MGFKNRSFVVAANWKMHKSPHEAADFFASFIPKLGSVRPSREVIFFVPAIDLMIAEQSLKSSGIGFGAQNCHFEAKGAFTGENSPAIIGEIGCTHALVGHSERRALFHESDHETGRKVRALQTFGVIPMLCVGETLGEREAGQTDSVIIRQLEAGLAERLPGQKIVLAYEPVWAIGTGRVATPDQANAAHLSLRLALARIAGEDYAQSTSIVYGGSVKPENAAEIARQPEVDGFLVGGASLDVASFLSLCQTEKV